MIARLSTGWEVVLADLAMILFLVTAAALSQTDESAHGMPVSPQGEALAFYSADSDAPPLREWLASQPGDARQQLTIVAQYGPGDQEAALRQAGELAREAREGGAQARIVIEPGEGGTTASLAFDTPRATLARGLLGSGHDD